MSLFMIETSAVDSSASSVGKLASQVSSLGSNVSGYDVSCNGEFDFESVKNIIVSNLEACVTKINNTSTILSAVSESHIKLQNSIKFNTSSKKSSKTNSTSSSSNGVYYSSVGYSAAIGGGISAASNVSSNGNSDKMETESKKIEFKKVDYVYFEDDNVTDESKKVVSSNIFSYNEKGYGRYNEYYVVAVDKSVGKVGDVIRFTKDDGEVVEAIIGFNTGSNSKDETIHFVVTNDEEFKFKAIDSTKNILDNNEKIENIGYYEEIKNDYSARLNHNNTGDNQNNSQDEDSSTTEITSSDKPESN